MSAIVLLSRLQRRLLHACRGPSDKELDQILNEHQSPDAVLAAAHELKRKGLLFDWHTTQEGMTALLGDFAP